MATIKSNTFLLLYFNNIYLSKLKLSSSHLENNSLKPKEAKLTDEHKDSY